MAPDLLGRHFAAERPDTVRLADISYLPTGEGWLYLATIKDMATSIRLDPAKWPGTELSELFHQARSRAEAADNRSRA